MISLTEAREPRWEGCDVFVCFTLGKLSESSQACGSTRELAGERSLWESPTVMERQVVVWTEGRTTDAVQHVRKIGSFTSLKNTVLRLSTGVSLAS